MKKYFLAFSLLSATMGLAQPLTPEPSPNETEEGVETYTEVIEVYKYESEYEIDPVDSTLEQKTPSFENVMVKAFKAGNATLIASYFSSNVDMSINGKENLYSNKQGEQVLKNFFNSHRPSDFSIIHKGKSGQSEYLIGELNSGDTTYRVTINTKMTASGKEITSLTIEEN